eukprot:Em0001g2482a
MTDEGDRKRALSAEASEEPADKESAEENEVVGPVKDDEPPAKKRKALPYEKMYLEKLPCAEMYEKSYMHRDIITHVVCTKSNFVVTASSDGHVKFWKKQEEGIEFVKHFRAHLGLLLLHYSLLRIVVTSSIVGPNVSLYLTTSSSQVEQSPDTAHVQLSDDLNTSMSYLTRHHMIPLL